MQRRLAEKIAAVLTLHSAPEETAGSYAADESYSYEAGALPAHDIALRAVSACAIVTPSAYSRSPPTGSPRAIRETVRGYRASFR
jgi:hypothetical protein